jgi:hypothetical protein
MARGLRNCNPGNIRQSGTRYRGEVFPSRDTAFKQFESMAWGYRAMFVLLYTYHRKYGKKTLRAMIDMYAPPSENNTEGYIRRVAAEAGVGADDELDVLDAHVMRDVVGAMSAVENGCPAVYQDVAEGWDLFRQFPP